MIKLSPVFGIQGAVSQQFGQLGLNYVDTIIKITPLVMFAIFEVYRATGCGDINKVMCDNTMCLCHLISNHNFVV